MGRPWSRYLAFRPPRLLRVTTPNAARFGRIVAARRRELGLTSEELSDAGGPTRVTLRKLEAGTTPQPGLKTFAKLDKVLKWRAGSAARTFDGGEPDPLDHRRRRPIVDLPITATDTTVTLRTEVVAELIEKVSALERIAKKFSDDQDLQETVLGLQLYGDRVLRAWIIGQAEVLRLRGDTPSADPIFTRMLGDYLNREPPADDPRDSNDLLYLRWLLGMPVKITEEQQSGFAARWESVAGST